MMANEEKNTNTQNHFAILIFINNCPDCSWAINRAMNCPKIILFYPFIVLNPSEFPPISYQGPNKIGTSYVFYRHDSNRKL